MYMPIEEPWIYAGTKAGISETRFWSWRPRPRLKISESQWRDRDWKGLSLNNETETETEKVWVSMTRPRLKMSESQRRDQDWKGPGLNGFFLIIIFLKLHKPFYCCFIYYKYIFTLYSLGLKRVSQSSVLQLSSTWEIKFSIIKQFWFDKIPVPELIYIK